MLESQYYLILQSLEILAMIYRANNEAFVILAHKRNMLFTSSSFCLLTSGHGECSAQALLKSLVAGFHIHKTSKISVD